MATYDDLFGKKSDRRFMKFEQVGETLLLIQRGEPKRVPQKNQKTGKNTWLVQVNDGDRYKPMDEGDFDENEVHNAFQPDGDLVIPVTVAGRKLADGSGDAEFEPFDTDWEVTKGQIDKLKDAMLETQLPAVVGARYAVKLLSKDVKPFKYSVNMLPPKE